MFWIIFIFVQCIFVEIKFFTLCYLYELCNGMKEIKGIWKNSNFCVKKTSRLNLFSHFLKKLFKKGIFLNILTYLTCFYSFFLYLTNASNNFCSALKNPRHSYFWRLRVRVAARGCSFLINKSGSAAKFFIDKSLELFLKLNYCYRFCKNHEQNNSNKW